MSIAMDIAGQERIARLEMLVRALSDVLDLRTHEFQFGILKPREQCRICGQYEDARVHQTSAIVKRQVAERSAT